MALPLTGYHSIEHYVKDIAKTGAFYTNVLKFKQIGQSTPEAEARDGMRRVVMAGGPTVHVILSQPLAEHSVAAQYLKLHPEGIGFLNFRVSDLTKAYQFLNERKATFLYEPVTIKDSHGSFSQFAMATALDDVNYRLLDDSKYDGFGPGFAMTQKAGSYINPLGFQAFDHLTANVRTLQPLIAFYRDVMGFESFWEFTFHTNDVNPSLPVGSGLKSTVMRHRDSGIKFANNEPLAPYFRNSQIDIYTRDNVGSGIQHVALLVDNIVDVTRNMREDGCHFLGAPASYYEKVPARLKAAGFRDKIAEPMPELEKLSILIDGSEKGYLLQIFSKEMSFQFGSHDPQKGALFYEIIQREGDDGFGKGNFRALFETIEIDQMAMAKVKDKLPLELL